MDLRFIAPHLRRLDQAGTEVLATALFTDERPAHGVVGLLDWRLGGRLSELMKRGFATGAAGEVLLVPGRPRLPFDKLLLFGAGESDTFGEEAFLTVVQRMLSTLEGLRVRSAVVELPGRHLDALPPERAASLLLELAGDREAHDVWTLVEPGEAQRTIQKRVLQERRRAR